MRIAVLVVDDVSRRTRRPTNDRTSAMPRSAWRRARPGGLHAVAVPAAVAAVLFAAVPASAAPDKPAEAGVVIGTCGDSEIEATAGTGGGAATLRGLVVTAGERWSFTGHVSMARLGARTRTVVVEDLRTVERKPPRAKDTAPSGLFIDLLLDDKKLVLRHASEGDADPAYALDLDHCTFHRATDGVLEEMVPPPAEPPGCAPAQVRSSYRTQVTRVAKLSDADTDREAQALCEDHQKTLDARTHLEQAISDRAARDRLAARGPALLKVEAARLKAWDRVDGCLAGETRAQGVAALHDAEARTRACYAKIAAKP
jgi:hypothetical protein